MSDFFRINHNGGYIGRICWCNKDALGNEGHFGQATMMPNKIKPSWAGSIPLIRYLIK